jgi:hypothetical protein
MQLHPQAIERLRAAQLRPEAVGTIFEAILQAIESGMPGEYAISYQQPEDTVAEGDMVPVIILTLQPARKPAPNA